MPTTAAKRRKNTAHGASRGEECKTDQPPRICARTWIVWLYGAMKRSGFSREAA